MRVLILAVGRCRDRAIRDLSDVYLKRLRWPVEVREIEVRGGGASAEAARMLSQLPPDARVVALDERGEHLDSEALAGRIGGWRDEGRNLAFLIGGADGHDEEVRRRADLLLAFGRLTWPHMLARVMLLEQVYRAQQILAGHPYHRG